MSTAAASPPTAPTNPEGEGLPPSYAFDAALEIERLQAQIRQLQQVLKHNTPAATQGHDVHASASQGPAAGTGAAAIPALKVRLPHIAARHRRMVWAVLIVGVVPSFILLLAAIATVNWADGSAPAMPDILPRMVAFKGRWGLFKTCYTYNDRMDYEQNCIKNPECMAFAGKCVFHGDTHDSWTVNNGNPLLDNDKLRTVVASMLIALLATFLMVCGVGADIFMWARGLGQEFGKSMVLRVYYTMIAVWVSAIITLIIGLFVWSKFVDDDLEDMYRPPISGISRPQYNPEHVFFYRPIRKHTSFTLTEIAAGLLGLAFIGILVRIGLAKRDNMEHELLLQNSQIQLAPITIGSRADLATNITYNSTPMSPHAASSAKLYSTDNTSVLEETV